MADRERGAPTIETPSYGREIQQLQKQLFQMRRDVELLKEAAAKLATPHRIRQVIQAPVTAPGPFFAPPDAAYLVTAADSDLTAGVVVGTTPGGELGGTWGSPTVDATHSGSAHHNSLSIGADGMHSLATQVLSGVAASTSQTGHIKEYVYNVKAAAYGALGDDSNDDTAEIQAAIDAAEAAGGGTVFFPAGTYKISSALTMQASSVRLLGVGGKSAIKQYTADADVIQVGSAGTQYNGMTIEQLAITAGATKTAGAGIAIQNSVYTRILNVNIASQFQGINAYDKNFGTFVIGCIITGSVATGIRYTSTGASSATNGLFLNNCVLDNATGDQPTVAGINWINGEGVYAVNCEILRQKVGLLMNPGNGQGASWGFFTNCLFDLCSSYGVEVGPTGTATVYGNVFTNSWASTNDTYGIYLHPATGTFDGMEFDGCRVLNNSSHGWYIGQYCDHVKILGGYAIGNSRTTTNTTDGVYVEDSTDALAIIGLVSKGAIWGYANNQRYGINYAGTSIDNTIVAGCDLRSNGTGAFNNLPTTGEHRITNNLGLTQAFLGGESFLFGELGSAPGAVSNGARVWAEDNGAGKTRLMARFGSGADQQLAIEP